MTQQRFHAAKPHPCLKLHFTVQNDFDFTHDHHPQIYAVYALSPTVKSLMSDT